MGYTRVVQFGDTIEIYDYEKALHNTPRTPLSREAKRKNKAIRELKKKQRLYKRFKGNSRRTVNNFFRLCHHNNVFADSICFLTLTFAYDLTYKEACRHVARFLERIKKTLFEVPIRYISVPELTKKGRFHFHLLVYDLPSEVSVRERETRNLQRLFERGYLDIRLASYTSAGIAGYMAKYMAKAFADDRYGTARVYNTSRNIKRPYSAGGNSIYQHLDWVIPTDGVVKEEKIQYDVPYLGKCLLVRTISHGR